MQYENYDLHSVVTPVHVGELNRLLTETEYCPLKTKFLIDGFTHGFDIGYRGSRTVKLNSPNLRFSIGSKTELWNKVMKEVKLKRYAGPYESPPFEHYIQSPIGLVPKDGGASTRLIFHLSHPRKTKGGVNISVNSNTPADLTTVKYADFDCAVRLCIAAGKGCKCGKSDFSSAFRHLGLRPEDWMLMVMKAEHPTSGKIYYFVDKCLPFGAARSCALFQAFSDAVAHVVVAKSNGRKLVNYLDDFFFAALLKLLCNRQIKLFLDICEAIKFPVSLEKTFWATTHITFLGLLIDTVNQFISIPIQKINKAIDLICMFMHRRRVTLLEVQQLAGVLNFLCKAIVPGRAFLRRLYGITKGVKLPHHHIRMNNQIRADLRMWLKFLGQPTAYARPFLDFDSSLSAVELDMYTDASRNPELGCGGVCNSEWFFMPWDKKLIEDCEPSIVYLELYAVTIAVLLWIHKFKNKRIYLFCDNMSVVI